MIRIDKLDVQRNRKGTDLGHLQSALDPSPHRYGQVIGHFSAPRSLPDHLIGYQHDFR
jgi:hypothetical protein